MKKRRRLTVERLHELLDYDPATGVFTWLEQRGRVKAGDVAGTITDDAASTLGSMNAAIPPATLPICG